MPTGNSALAACSLPGMPWLSEDGGGWTGLRVGVLAGGVDGGDFGGKAGAGRGVGGLVAFGRGGEG